MSIFGSQEIVAANYGGGVNSGALLLGLLELESPPTLITYADPGNWLDEPAEKPETYEYIEMFGCWLVLKGFPKIKVVRHKHDTLYRSCIRNGTLPSKAYGFPGCSVKFKHQLIESYETDLYGPYVPITKLIGYHAKEKRGSAIKSKGRYTYRYILKEWGWDQEDCVAAFVRHGLPVPPKSSCWFCPSMKKPEIIQLHERHPDLFAKAVGMEKNAEAYHARGGGVTRGLGRSWSWADLVQAEDQSRTELPDPSDINCMCDD